MIKLNILLVLILIFSGLGVVTAQLATRKLVISLEKEHNLTDQLAIERNQLLIEQRTWAMPGYVEKIAKSKLDMIAPSSSHITVITSDHVLN